MLIPSLFLAFIFFQTSFKNFTSKNLYFAQLQEFSVIREELNSYESPKQVGLAAVHSEFPWAERIKVKCTLLNGARIYIVEHVDGKDF